MTGSPPCADSPVCPAHQPPDPPRPTARQRTTKPATVDSTASTAIKPLPERVSRVSDRLTEAEQQAIIEGFQAGTSKQKLAERYGISMSSIKQLLREHGVRGERWPQDTA